MALWLRTGGEGPGAWAGGFWFKTGISHSRRCRALRMLPVVWQGPHQLVHHRHCRNQLRRGPLPQGEDLATSLVTDCGDY